MEREERRRRKEIKREKERERERETESERRRERKRSQIKFSTKQFLCDLFLPKKILMRNFIPNDPQLNV